ncbi:hypothetical protein C440_11268 [Haloferax mucosum ATCC BAA-1512]|uniref:Uncharacterized protein n=1 Tax=Haloferax mucosum ATCC BAA-1512 TaxID=662479 RepID=M0IDP9_9EURY|nr:hypothetical protein [Haloferax mucosum]ELZ94197.1 hypothetical protein C440_11268 [Haloferax mucosum ATCC BAA-1512]
MVGPSLSDDETELASNRLRAFFILLIGFSAALIAVQAGATLLQTGIVLVVGVVLGALLMWYLSRWSREFTEVNRRY